jgi:hypothetical protein
LPVRSSSSASSGCVSVRLISMLGYRFASVASAAVIQGVEHEELFDADLNLVGRSDNHVGDVTRVGSSARRYHD